MELTIISGLFLRHLSVSWEAEVEEFNRATPSSSEVHSNSLYETLQRNKEERRCWYHWVRWNSSTVFLFSVSVITSVYPLPLLFLLQFDVVSTFPSRFRVGATMLAKRESLKCMGKHFHLVKFRFDLACRVVWKIVLHIFINCKCISIY